MQLNNGYMYIWGNIAPYVISYYHYKGDAAATLTTSVIILPLSYLVNAATTPIGTYLYTVMDARLLHFIVSLGMVVIIAATSYMQSWWAYVVFQGILFPCVMGFQSLVSLQCAWEWFPDKQSIVAGFVLACFGISTFFFGFITTYIVNPGNAKPTVPDDGSTTDSLYPIDIADRVPIMLRTNAAIVAVLAVLGLLGVSRNPEFVRQQQII